MKQISFFNLINPDPCIKGVECKEVGKGLWTVCVKGDRWMTWAKTESEALKNVDEARARSGRV